MPDIIQFISKAELTATQNIEAFISMCRYKLTVFGRELVWDGSWDVTQWCGRVGRRARTAAVWSNHDTSKQKLGDIMRQPFLDFAKSYFRYQHAFRPTKAVGIRMSALRALERALNKMSGEVKVEKSDAAVFNMAANLIKEKFKENTAYRIGSQLEMIAEFINANAMVEVGFDWKNFIGRPEEGNRVGKKADDRREKLLPREAALDAIARAFAIATDSVDVVVSSLLAILFSAPDRINEVLRLLVNCEVSQRQKDGEEAYGLRYWPSKGAESMVKWIVGTMVDVVKRAIANIKEQTEEARTIAAWYENHPDQIYLPDELNYLRKVKLLSASDIMEIIGLSSTNKVYSWAKGNHVKRYKNKGLFLFRFEDVQEAIVSMLPAGFPYLDAKTNLKYSEALFVVQTNFFQPKKLTYRCMFESINIDTINDQLGSRLQYGVQSIFSRLGLTELDGSPIQITTHQLRHWLNTLAQRGGLSQLDIAKWSGRMDIPQNANYDHMTPNELIQKMRSIDDGSMFGPLADLVKKAPISRDEFLQLKIPTVHITDIGFCIHDWTMTPCQKFRDCINCTEHLCIKGDTKKTERIKKQLSDAEEQLKRAEAAVSDGDAGADIWLKHHLVAVQRLRSLVSILDDPDVPIGAIVQLSIEKEFSLIGMAIEDRARLGDKDGKLLNALLTSESSQLAHLLALPDGG